MSVLLQCKPPSVWIMLGRIWRASLTMLITQSSSEIITSRCVAGARMDGEESVQLPLNNGRPQGIFIIIIIIWWSSCNCHKCNHPFNHNRDQNTQAEYGCPESHHPNCHTCDCHHHHIHEDDDDDVQAEYGSPDSPPTLQRPPGWGGGTPPGTRLASSSSWFWWWWWFWLWWWCQESFWGFWRFLWW